MVKLTAPSEITVGEPIEMSFEADQRVAGRIRLTHGTELVSFRFAREGQDASESATAHRVRGRNGSFVLTDWGEHAAETELVLRFEGAKVWMRVK